MRVVIYTYDLEPITIIDLDRWALDCLIKAGQVVLPILQEPRYHAMTGDFVVPRPDIRECTIRLEPIYFPWRGVHSEMLYTRDEESSLLLKSVFLPGQTAAVLEQRRQAFAQGFAQAIRTMSHGSRGA